MDKEFNETVEYCIENIKKHNSDFEIKLYDIYYLNKIKRPINFNLLNIQHRTDYLRLYLLKVYGGIWIDVSTIVKINIKQIINLDTDKLQIFKNKIYHLETCFLACNKNNIFIEQWFNEFISAIEKGFKIYNKENDKYINNKSFKSFLPYLTLNLSFHKIYKNNTQEIFLLDSYYNPTKYFSYMQQQYSKDFVINLKNDNDYKLIKLRGQERRYFQKYNFPKSTFNNFIFITEIKHLNDYKKIKELSKFFIIVIFTNINIDFNTTNIIIRKLDYKHNHTLYKILYTLDMFRDYIYHCFIPIENFTLKNLNFIEKKRYHYNEDVYIYKKK